ncbi:MAG: NUDIX domain-containing protein [Actinomycetota bacterium]|nr:NUDIX domain-containing protein [Actinomycetota bacterium]
MSEVPRKEAVVAVLRRGERVLVIRRGPKTIMSGYWSPPSGRIEPGETHEAALVREIEEELGLSATPGAKVWECPTDDGIYLLHWWTAELRNTAFTLDPDEVSEARWVTSAEFHQLQPTFAGDRRFFDEVLPGLSAT